MLFILHKIRFQLNSTIALLIYNTLINSHLQYGILLWGKTYPSFIKHSQVLQKKCLKCCLALPLRTDSNTVFLKSKCLSIDKLYTLKLAILVYNFINNPSTIPANILKNFKLTSAVHRHSTRQVSQTELFKFQFNSIVKNQSIKIQAPQIWNSIPQDLKSIKPLHLFKGHLKTYLLNN
jgi:hypothetical protein